MKKSLTQVYCLLFALLIISKVLWSSILFTILDKVVSQSIIQNVLVLGMLMVWGILVRTEIPAVFMGAVFIVIAMFEIFIGHASAFAIVFLIGISSMVILPEKLIKLHVIAMLAATGIVVFLSTIGIIPMFGRHLYVNRINDVFFGFYNANTLAGILMFSVFELLVIVYHDAKKKPILIVYGGLVFLFNFFVLESRTSAAVLIFGCLVYVFGKHKPDMLRFFGKISLSFLIVTSVLTGVFFNMYNDKWAVVDKILSFRPRIWNWYVNHYDVTIFGQQMNQNLQRKAAFYLIRSFSFDSAYLYALYFGGLLVAFLFIAYLYLHLIDFFKIGMSGWLILTLVVMVYGFTETTPLFYTSTVFSVSFGSFIRQKYDWKF